ncbi:MAG: hypothetical protein J5850_02585 [Clostridia bacterium]|nr:hypothetical protein [Clostridia bacterium]
MLHLLNLPKDLKDNWTFFAVNSPCSFPPKPYGLTGISLPEQSRGKDGCFLATIKFLGEEAFVEATIAQPIRNGNGDIKQDAAGAVGFVGGAPAPSNTVCFAVYRNHASLMIRSGGAIGNDPWYDVKYTKTEFQFPVKLRIERKGKRYRCFANGVMMFDEELDEIPFDARGFVKGINVGDSLNPLYMNFDNLSFGGTCETSAVYGSVKSGEKCVPFASVHVGGHEEFFTLSDENGNYRIEGLPRGKHLVIAAAEDYLFAEKEIFIEEKGETEANFDLTEETQENIPRREYNLPNFDRSEHGYLSLNGSWQFAFDPNNEGVKKYYYHPAGPRLDKIIRVPFSWGSMLGFGEDSLIDAERFIQANTRFNVYQLTGEYGWYKRSFTVPSSFPNDEDVILHIGASCNVTNVWIDGRYVGMSLEEYADHAFNFGKLEPGTKHTVAVQVRFPHNINSHSMGKQIFWFSSCPGIWQSVWIEPRGEKYVKSIRLTPQLEFEDLTVTASSFDVEIDSVGGERATYDFTAPDGRTFSAEAVLCCGRGKINVKVDDPILWDYKQGNLYTVKVSLYAGGKETDSLVTHSGLRKIENKWLYGHSPDETSDKLEQYQYIFLNNRPFYMVGVLDQSYNPFGIYTYRSLGKEGKEGYRGSIEYDVRQTLEQGYNLSRIHIKENEPLWYFEADKAGLPVWTEHPGNFYATPDDPDWQAAYNREMYGMTERIYNNPSIIIVSSINESWGIMGWHVLTPWTNELRYNFMRDIALETKKRMPHVLVCDNSGFGKTSAAELNDFHLYPHEYNNATNVFKDWMDKSFPGSTHNYVNASHTQFAPYHIGDAVQNGAPIILSEFSFAGGAEYVLRKFQKYAGFARVNIASYEGENYAPLTAERYIRDFGYVDSDMNHIGLTSMNNTDQIIIDKAPALKLNAGETFEFDTFIAHFDHVDYTDPRVVISFAGVGPMGEIKTHVFDVERKVEAPKYRVSKETFSITVPKEYKAGILFAELYDCEKRVSTHNTVLYIPDGHSEKPYEVLAEFRACDPAEKNFRYTKTLKNGDANLFCGTGDGYAEYEFEIKGEAKDPYIAFEIGPRYCITGVNRLNEKKESSEVEITIDGKSVGTITAKDDSASELSLFRTATVSFEKKYEFGPTGNGERIELKLPAEYLTAGKHRIRFAAKGHGLTLFGYMSGICSLNPTIFNK